MPSVFWFPKEIAEILGSMRADGKTFYNDSEKGELYTIGISLSEEINEAAEGCSVEIIRFTRAG